MRRSARNINSITCFIKRFSKIYCPGTTTIEHKDIITIRIEFAQLSNQPHACSWYGNIAFASFCLWKISYFTVGMMIFIHPCSFSSMDEYLILRYIRPHQGCQFTDTKLLTLSPYEWCAVFCVDFPDFLLPINIRSDFLVFNYSSSSKQTMATTISG